MRDFGLCCVGSFRKGDWLAENHVNELCALEIDGDEVKVTLRGKDSKTYVYIVSPSEVDALKEWFKNA